jgi:hypothetical protein
LQIGEGDGLLKLRFADGFEATIKVVKEQTIEALKKMIGENFRIDGFSLSTPPSLTALDDKKCLAELGLFPRGVLLLNGGVSTDC